MGIHRRFKTNPRRWVITAGSRVGGRSGCWNWRWWSSSPPADECTAHPHQFVTPIGGDVLVQTPPYLFPTSFLLQPNGHTPLLHCCSQFLPKSSWKLPIVHVCTPPTCSKVGNYQSIGFLPFFFGLFLHFVMNWPWEPFFTILRPFLIQIHHGASLFYCLSATTRLVASKPFVSYPYLRIHHAFYDELIIEILFFILWPFLMKSHHGGPLNFEGWTSHTWLKMRN